MYLFAWTLPAAHPPQKTKMAKHSKPFKNVVVVLLLFRELENNDLNFKKK